MVKSMGKCSMCRKELRWNQFDKLTTNLAGMIESYQVCYDEHGNKKDQNADAPVDDVVSPKNKASGPSLLVGPSSISALLRENCSAELGPYQVAVKPKFGTKIGQIFSAVRFVFARDATSKVIMFVQYDEMMSLLKDACESYGHCVATLNGKKSLLLEEFQAKLGGAGGDDVVPAFGGGANGALGGAGAGANGGVPGAAGAGPAGALPVANQGAAANGGGPAANGGGPAGHAAFNAPRRAAGGRNGNAAGNSRKPKILLMKFQDAAGLNLTAADNVFFIHPHVADVEKACADEHQAMARVRRMGQLKARVYKWRFVCSDTVEQDLVLEHRAALAKRDLSKQQHAAQLRRKEEEKRNKRGRGGYRAGRGGGMDEDDNSDMEVDDGTTTSGGVDYWDRKKKLKRGRSSGDGAFNPAKKKKGNDDMDRAKNTSAAGSSSGLFGGFGRFFFGCGGGSAGAPSAGGGAAASSSSAGPVSGGFFGLRGGGGAASSASSGAVAGAGSKDVGWMKDYLVRAHGFDRSIVDGVVAANPQGDLAAWEKLLKEIGMYSGKK